MSQMLQFGIPGLDELLGRRGEATAEGDDAAFGLHLDPGASTSICVLGPDGTGKSLLAFHLASRYAALAFPNKQPAIMCASTDLSYEKAREMWIGFGLQWPSTRASILEQPNLEVGAYDQIPLQQYRPLKGLSSSTGAVGEPLANYLRGGKSNHVAFVDLESNTAGDDWGFLTRLMAALTAPASPSDPLHLLVIDAVEGLQTMSGDTDAFGQERTRRSRIAQLARAASKKCHLVFVIEDPGEGERFPEQFVTDAVIRLRTVTGNAGYAFRTAEVEKARAQTHVRGQHVYTVRSGKGSTTWQQINPDDRPYELHVPTPAGPETRPLAYIRVFPSIDYLYRKKMKTRTYARQRDVSLTPLGFGVTYLDNILDADKDGNRGLPARTVTAIIGARNTRKSLLGRAFLSQCFRRHTDTMMQDSKPALASLEKIVNVEEYLQVVRPPEAGTLTQVDESAYNEWRKKTQANVREAIAAIDQAKRDEDAKRSAEAIGSVPSTAIVTAAGMQEPKQAADAQISRDAGEGRETKGKATGRAKDDPGVAVLLTTEDIHPHDLVRRMFQWLYNRDPDPDANPLDAVALALAESRTICRRLEIHTLASSVLFHIIKDAVYAAKQIVLGDRADEPVGKLTEDEVARCAEIRVLIDNWSNIQSMYASVREDALFLPYLLFHLRREGVTTLILESQSVGDGLPGSYAAGSSLAQFIDNALMTWNVRFQGRRMVAISPLTAFTSERRSMTREVVRGEEAIRLGLDTVHVDPHLELLTGLSTGEPIAVPLRVRLFTENDAGDEYARRLERLLSDLFPAVKGLGGKIVSHTQLPFEEHGRLRYERLREICFLHEGSIDHTVVWQVDEFWSVGHGPRGEVPPMADYLKAVTHSYPSRSVDNQLADPYAVFQRTKEVAAGAVHRHQFFHMEKLGYGSPESGLMDRVPYIWDFAFLCCRHEAWKRAFPRKLMGEYTVEDVWSGLRGRSSSNPATSWRVFLEAATIVAQANTKSSTAPVGAFDVSMMADESLSCLVLEVWFSEIFRALENEPLRRAKFVRSLSMRQGSDVEEWSLRTLSQVFPVLLYKSLLLLFDVLEPLGVAELKHTGSFPIRDATPSAVAVRHWYKTASRSSPDHDPGDPVVPMRLPGNFSTRGDWFLAIASGSRSVRLGERAIDLMSSKRANLDRLELGIGLPTRLLSNERGYDALQTALWTIRKESTEKEGENGDFPLSPTCRLRYSELTDLGPQDSDEGHFSWLWRSRLTDYDRHSRAWQRWLRRMLLDLEDLRRSRSPLWVKGFRIYDEMEAASASGAPPESVLGGYSSYARFTELLKALEADLDAATATP